MISLIGSVSLVKWAATRRGELTLVLRVTVASALAYAVGKLLGLSQGSWAVITAIIVMQASLGGSVKAAMDRMAGTLVGALWGAAISFFLPHGDVWLTGVAIIVAVAPTALCAALNPSFRVAPITAMIVLIPSGVVAVSPLAYAFERVSEIAVGIVIGVGVALFVLPARARDQVLKAAARIADLNADLLGALVSGLVEGQGRPDVAAIHARIRAGLRQMDASAEEALRERRAHLGMRADLEPIVRTLYRARHDLVIIGRASSAPLPKLLAPSLEAPLLALRDETITLLRQTAGALRVGEALPSSSPFDTALQAYVSAMDALRGAGVFRQLDSDDVGRIYALRFGFEQLGVDLKDLLKRGDKLRE